MNTVKGQGPTFRLLMPLEPGAPSEQPSIVARGKRWGLVEYNALPNRTDAPDYTCISYVCGKNQIVNPFDDKTKMSDRTISAIETILTNESPKAIWIDAFCVPSDPTLKAACLSQLGVIYSRAEKVVVMLSQVVFSVLERIGETKTLNNEMIGTLERDDWVSRAWTYQELVNNDNIRFTALGGSTYTKADNILNSLTIAIDKYMKERNWDSFDFYSKYPRISRFEDVILDWKISRYLERSAYQALSSIDDRVATNAEDLSYLIGAISDNPITTVNPPDGYSFEHLLQVCETKGDYSFIYSTARRSNKQGKRWRPANGERLRPIFATHSWGLQSGIVHRTHITLDKMSILQLGSLNSKAKTFIQNRLYSPKEAKDRENWPTLVFSRLSLAGFSGCGDFFETEHGYFYTHLPIENHDGMIIVISTEVQMAIGSPGLLLKKEPSEIYKWVGVGLFVGRVPKVCVSVNVG